jgi:hypothetical protein
MGRPGFAASVHYRPHQALNVETMTNESRPSPDEEDEKYRGKVAEFTALAQELMWAPVSVRKAIQEAGFNLSPSNFYSCLPSVDDIVTSFESDAKPIYLKGFDDSELTAFLQVIQPYASDFSPATDGDEKTARSYFWNNTQFGGVDAMAYFSVIRHKKPRRIVEIGSGFSTLVADAAIQLNGFGELICIEPYPRDFLRNTSSVQLISEKIQDISTQRFADLMDGTDILFIDSTHTVKIGSDCLYIYLVLLPSIKTPVLFHAHDILLPFGMPKQWALDHQIYWTEQYILYAYLLDNPRATIKFSSAYHNHFHISELTKFMQGKATIGGASIWVQLE